MEPAMTVNWEALDSLVIDYAESENLVEDPSPSSSSPSSSSSSYNSRLLIRRIRALVEAGELVAALDLIRNHAPSVLDDHRLLFRLQKQKFLELLRNGSSVEDREAAIKCLRSELAPCALNAYPEAFEEFKHVLLAFIYDKEDLSSPVANEWSEKRRLDLAALSTSVLIAHLQAYDPVLPMALRYLLSTHKELCLRQGVESPISDIIRQLVVAERDPPATPQESFYEAPPYDEVDIQALAHAVQLTRQGAVYSLRYSKGDLFLAFQNELSRMKLNIPMLDGIIHEYCIYRGLLGCEAGDTSGNSAKRNDASQGVIEDCSLRENSSTITDCGLLRTDGQNCSNDVNREDMLEISSSSVNMNFVDTECRFSDDTVDTNEGCSTSGSHQVENFAKKIPRNKRYECRKRSSRHKRWRGRVEADTVSNALFAEKSEGEPSSTHGGMSLLNDELVGPSSGGLGHVDRDQTKYDTILEIKDFVQRGMVSEVVEQVHKLDPNFFDYNPELLFWLKQVEFLKLVKCGDNSSALRVASSCLGPIAAKNSAFLKPLKETLLALLNPNEDSYSNMISLANLALSFQDAIGRTLGIAEPLLMKIVRTTLHSHDEWFKLQMCNDRFEGLLKIDYLKDVNTRTSLELSLGSSGTSSTFGNSQALSSQLPTNGSNQMQGPSRDPIFDETAILKVMEFLALPRSEAIHLLAEYNGNPETVIQQLFT